ncbi:MAG TPA: LytTR family DNA-binding domain-containing protein [Cyclobacteriaceae bacterium]|nr:LytTR family DNA-binding domain-containing protein [Cyclobacteriaceae bacterium]
MKQISEMNCVIIDDEPLARECITNYVKEVDFLKLAGEGNNPLDLIRLLETHSPDLIFLDIQMPVMNGIDFLKTISRVPMVIITTAYPSYALESFQLDVMDYLLKPIVFKRFFQAVTKARDYHQLVNRSVAQPGMPFAEDYIFLKCGHKFERIYLSEILYIEALQNYVTVYTNKGKFITQLPLKNVEQNLSGQPFVRVHKSYIVSIAKVEAIENNEIILQGKRIPISRNLRDQVMESVVNTKLWKK